MTSPDPMLTPLFLAGEQGPLFALYVEPAAADGARPAAALYLPPFAEEMNRARRMSGLLARRLAAQGIASLTLDPSGTGDSHGDFGETGWSQWKRDAAAGIAWLRDQGHDEIVLVGLRTGANLALETAAELGTEVGAVVLWQPVLKGSVFLSQFLRIRVASALTSNGNKESVRDLRERLNAGETLEVAGYPLYATLVDDIDRLEPTAPAARCQCPIHWLDVTGEGADGPPPATATALKSIEASGATLAYRTVTGEPFWTIEEPVMVTELVEETCRRIAAAP